MTIEQISQGSSGWLTTVRTRTYNQEVQEDDQMRRKKGMLKNMEVRRCIKASFQQLLILSLIQMDKNNVLRKML